MGAKIDVAFHEAGHAVIALDEGIGLGEFIRSGRKDGYTPFAQDIWDRTRAAPSSWAPKIIKALPATVLDISCGGFQLLLSRRFETGTLLVVDVRDPAGQATRMLVARVARVTSLTRGRWIHGCAFSVPLAAEDLESLLKNPADPRLPHKKAS